MRTYNIRALCASSQYYLRVQFMYWQYTHIVLVLITILYVQYTYQYTPMRKLRLSFTLLIFLFEIPCMIFQHSLANCNILISPLGLLFVCKLSVLDFLFTLLMLVFLCTLSLLVFLCKLLTLGFLCTLYVLSFLCTISVIILSLRLLWVPVFSCSASF